MSKKAKNKRKDTFNDKNYNQFGKMGWCLKENVICYGNCRECTLHRFPEIETQDDEEYENSVEEKVND